MPDPKTRCGRQARDLQGGVGDHVDRVGDQQQDRLRGDLEQPGDHRPGEGDVGLGQLQAGLARLLLGPGGDHHQVGPAADLDVVGADHGGLGHELEPVVEVEHLGPGLVGVDVVEGDGPADPPDQAGVGAGGPDAAGPDDGDLGRADGCLGVDGPIMRATATGIDVLAMVGGPRGQPWSSCGCSTGPTSTSRARRSSSPWTCPACCRCPRSGRRRWPARSACRPGRRDRPGASSGAASPPGCWPTWSGGPRPRPGCGPWPCAAAPAPSRPSWWPPTRGGASTPPRPWARPWPSWSASIGDPRPGRAGGGSAGRPCARSRPARARRCPCPGCRRWP